MKWVKNTKGKEDAMLTFALVSFSVVTLNLLLGTIGTFEFRDLSITLNLMDGGSMTAYLAATFGAYVSRRWTDANSKDKVTSSDNVNPENSNNVSDGDLNNMTDLQP